VCVRACVRACLRREGGIREPAMVRWPGHVRAGATSFAIAATYDIYPTGR
jgi:arylsulfatase A-like enzyme